MGIWACSAVGNVRYLTSRTDNEIGCSTSAYGTLSACTFAVSVTCCGTRSCSCNILLPQLTFVEAIFSFVFGDGDPNKGYEDARWSALGQLIQDR